MLSQPHLSLAFLPTSCGFRAHLVWPLPTWKVPPRAGLNLHSKSVREGRWCVASLDFPLQLPIPGTVLKLGG